MSVSPLFNSASPVNAAASSARKLQPKDAIDDPDAVIVTVPQRTITRPRALSEVELFNVPVQQWEVEGRTEIGGLNVITGARSRYKTFLIASLLRAVVLGSSWLSATARRTGPAVRFLTVKKGMPSSTYSGFLCTPSATLAATTSTGAQVHPYGRGGKCDIAFLSNSRLHRRTARFSCSPTRVDSAGGPWRDRLGTARRS